MTQLVLGLGEVFGPPLVPCLIWTITGRTVSVPYCPGRLGWG